MEELTGRLFMLITAAKEDRMVMLCGFMEMAPYSIFSTLDLDRPRPGRITLNNAGQWLLNLRKLPKTE